MGKCYLYNFPTIEETQGYVLEPSILYVVPDKKKWDSKFVFDNEIRTDGDIYLCSVFTCGYPDFLEFSKKIGKEKIIVGGYHPSLCPKDFVGHASKIVVGFGNNIDEIIRSKRSGIIRGKFRYNHMDRSIFPKNKLKLSFADIFPEQLIFSVNTFMGCLFSCDLSDFCSAKVMYKQTRIFYPLEYLKRELKILNQYAWNTLYIRDEGFFFHPKLRELVKLFGATGKRIISSGAPLPSVQNKESIVRFLKENNWLSLDLGLDASRDSIKDGGLSILAEQLHKYKINFNLSLIVNPPKEKNKLEHYFKKILKTLFKYMPTSVDIFFLTPFPGTRLFRNFKKRISSADYRLLDLTRPILLNSHLADWHEKKVATLKIGYYRSKEYSEMRNFDCGDNLNLQIIEMQKRLGFTKEKDWLPYSCK